MDTSVGVVEEVDFSAPGSVQTPDHVEVDLNGLAPEEVEGAIEEARYGLSDDVAIHVRYKIGEEYWGDENPKEVRDWFMKKMRTATRSGVEGHVVEMDHEGEVEDRLFLFLVKAARNHSPDKVQVWFVPEEFDEQLIESSLEALSRTLIKKFSLGTKVTEEFVDWYRSKDDLFKNQISLVERLRYLKFDGFNLRESSMDPIVKDLVNLEHRVRSMTFSSKDQWQNREVLFDRLDSDVAPKDAEEAVES